MLNFVIDLHVKLLNLFALIQVVFQVFNQGLNFIDCLKFLFQVCVQLIEVVFYWTSLLVGFFHQLNVLLGSLHWKVNVLSMFSNQLLLSLNHFL